MNLTDEEIQSKVKQFQEAFFEALMGFPCTVRFYKDGSLGYVVSAKEMDRLAVLGERLPIDNSTALTIADRISGVPEGFSKRVTLQGKITKGEGWATKHWSRMQRAHGPFLERFAKGTLNIQLDREWVPPDDERHWREAKVIAEFRQSQGLGSDDGTDFLACGNYFHPDLVVTEIDGHRICGFVYYAGGNPTPKERNRVEFVCDQHIRFKLGKLDEEQSYPVSITIAIRDGAGECSWE